MSGAFQPVPHGTINRSKGSTNMGFFDYAKRPIELGNVVVFSPDSNQRLQHGRVVRFTPKMIEVEWYRTNWAGQLRCTALMSACDLLVVPATIEA